MDSTFRAKLPPVARCSYPNWRKTVASAIQLVVFAAALAACSSRETDRPGHADAERRILEAHDARIAAMTSDSPSTRTLQTPEWRGVNLNGTPMSAGGFEGEDRTVLFERIVVLDRDVRIYGDVAALRWHANFWVQVNGRPSFAEMRLLDVLVLRDGQWLVDLTQVTPVEGTVGNRPDTTTHAAAQLPAARRP